MNPDDIAVRPVITGNAVRAVHREAPSRDSTEGRRPHVHEPEETEQAEVTEDSISANAEETHFIDLRA
ncbi:MAG: hypothetical protein KatS3mg022_0679 [Armatimonadota bacterium]|nr:MAG: hypothetical protein KatS3mg022_0679 [Armatimonadota bacterium]